MSCGIVDDIEDILKQDNGDFNESIADDLNRVGNKSYVVPKRLNGKKYGEVIDEAYKQSEQSNVPGVASIFVKTWGCTHNNSDSEYMAGQLAAYGYKLVGNSYFLMFCFKKK